MAFWQIPLPPPNWLRGFWMPPSYVHGHQLSEVDVILASHVDNVMTYVYVQRWLSHVKSCDDKPLSITKDIKKDIFNSYGDY